MCVGYIVTGSSEGNARIAFGPEDLNTKISLSLLACLRAVCWKSLTA